MRYNRTSIIRAYLAVTVCPAALHAAKYFCNTENKAKCGCKVLDMKAVQKVLRLWVQPLFKVI